MTVLLVVLLVLLWGAVIVPALLNNRHSPRSSTDRFRTHLQALGSRATSRPARPAAGAPGRRATSIDAGRWIMGPPPPRAARPPASRRPAPATRTMPARRPAPRQPYEDDWAALGSWDPVIDRRRQIFIGLLITAGATLVLGLIPGLGILLKANVGADVILAGYVVYLVRTKARTTPRDLVTTYEPDREEEEWLRAGER